MADDPTLFDIIATTRAMRRLKTDSVSDELVRRILEAGVCAANASNAQLWRFLVVTDEAIKRDVQVWYQRAFDEVVRDHYTNSANLVSGTNDCRMRQLGAVQYLTEHFHEAPVWIIPCVEREHGEIPYWFGASIYPAVQNMLLAARALGLGATLTTRHLLYKRESEAALGLPPSVHTFGIIPIGFPLGHFGPVRRGSLDEIVFQDHWGQPYEFIEDGTHTTTE